MQSGGFVPVPNEDVARNYPVGNGLSVTFKDENAPYVYTKTMGFSQLDRPVFEKYRLVKEEDAVQTSISPHTDAETEKVDNSLLEKINAKISQIEDDIDDIWREIDALKETPKKSVATNSKRKDVSED